MAKLMTVTVAERVVVDRFTNSINVLNIFEQVQVPEPPAEVFKNAKSQKRLVAVPAQFSVLVHWRRSDINKPETKVRQRVEFLGPNMKVFGKPAEMEFSLQEGNYARNVVGFNVMPLAGEGTYTARISVRTGNRWRRVGETSFQLSFQKSTAEAEIVAH